MYNKEALRKELEDCWKAGCNAMLYDLGHTATNHPNRDTYIKSRLAALDDGDEVGGVQELFRYGQEFFGWVESILPPMTKDEEILIDEIIKFKNVFDSTYAKIKIAQVQSKPVVTKIIEDVSFLRDKADDPVVKIAYNMVITICELHLNG